MAEKATVVVNSNPYQRDKPLVTKEEMLKELEEESKTPQWKVVFDSVKQWYEEKTGQTLTEE